MAEFDQSFLLKLLLSFIVGAVWISSATIIAERFGSRVGGFIGGLPSTVVVALVFIGYSQSVEAASQAASIIPLVMAINGLFVLIYLALVRYGLLLALGLGMIVWAAMVAFIVWVGVKSMPISLGVWLLSVLAGYYMVEHVMTIPHKAGVRVPYTIKQLFARGFFSGLIISTSVLIAHTSGPVAGGIFSNFPVIFTSTLFITHQSGGVQFSRAVAKTLMLSAMVNVGIYGAVAHFAYAHFGLIAGTITSLLVSLLSASFVYRFFKNRSA
jgi:hypothetical protein